MSLAQDASEITAIDSDIAGAKSTAVTIAKGLCGIGACIGLVNIARKAHTEGGQAVGEIIKWLLVLTISIGGLAAAILIF